MNNGIKITGNEESVNYVLNILEDYSNHPDSLIYVSHPYSGNQDNVDHLSRCLGVLSDEYTNANFISPIHNFSYRDYSWDKYEEDLNRCIRLLTTSDAMIIIGDWETSAGCKYEVEVCKELSIPYVFLDIKFGVEE